MAYSLDTSYLLDAWAVWYPLESFRGYWEVLLGAAKAGEVFVVDAVHDELDRQVPELVELFDQQAGDWTRSRAESRSFSRMLNTLERSLLKGKIIRSYPPQNIKKYMAIADPVLVLHAKSCGHVVVSKELSDVYCKKGPKIPDLCGHFGVVHAGPPAFADVLGYEYRAVRRGL